MSFTESFAASAAAVTDLGADSRMLADLADEALLAAHAVLLEHQRHCETYAAWFAAEIARRSPKSGGHNGLAQRKGFGSAEGFLQSLSPITRVEALQFVQAGELMNAAARDAGDDGGGGEELGAQPAVALWEAALGRALGTLRVAAVDAIRRALAAVADRAPAAELLAECEKLVARATVTSLDELAREARSARDRLDQNGIASREKNRHDQRYLKRWIRADGMYQGGFLLDPENGLTIFTALDAITAPRRIPQFREAGAAQTTAADPADLADTRTIDQRLADALVDMVRFAVDADPGTLFGTHRPAVRVLVTTENLTSPTGHGYFEGDTQPISRPTIDRFICDTGIIGIKFDRAGQILDLGRTQRLFSANQRLLLAVRDGGCIYPNCNKTPSQCEAHHIDPWNADHGLTNLDDGVLLCRHHHMHLHNNRWQIIRKDSAFWLKPPESEDPYQGLQPLRTRSPIMYEVST